VVSHRCFALLPRSSILCGCIDVPGRQVNAVWGRYPTACAMYVKKSLECIGGLVDKISPAFELRNSGVPAVAVLACRVPAGLVTLGLFALCGQSLRRVPPPALAGDGSAVVLCHPLRSTPNNALQHATGKIGGYTREPEVRSTREHYRLPPAYGRYSRRAYRAHELFLFAYR
jgi:hypothetical protein